MKGKIFGKLIVLEQSGVNYRKDRLWKCLCDCGNFTTVKTNNLTSGQTKSCGCLPTGKKRSDLTGQQYNFLTVMEFSHKDNQRTSHYKCACRCGNETVVSSRALKTGSTRSCGCWKKVKDNNRTKENNPNWNPNLSEEDRINGRYFEGYKEWCLTVKKRDNFRCVVCKENRSATLISHHLNNYKDFKDQRIDIDNGVCLCQNCHIDFHTLYGYKGTTKEMFNKYKETRNA